MNEPIMAIDPGHMLPRDLVVHRSIGQLATALALAQGEMKPAAKGSVNPHFAKPYASLTDITEAIRGPLTKHGLSYVQLVGANGDTVSVTTRLMHKSGEWIEGTLHMVAQQRTPQGLGGALTYARRYGLSAMVGICADDDDDGNVASKPAPTRPAAPAPAPAPAPAAAKPAPAKPLTDAQRYNVAAATIKTKLGAVAGEKMLESIAGKFTQPGALKVSDTDRPAYLAAIEAAAKGDAP
jgi:hypothetical protein